MGDDCSELDIDYWTWFSYHGYPPPHYGTDCNLLNTLDYIDGQCICDIYYTGTYCNEGVAPPQSSSYSSTGSSGYSSSSSSSPSSSYSSSGSSGYSSGSSGYSSGSSGYSSSYSSAPIGPFCDGTGAYNAGADYNQGPCYCRPGFYGTLCDYYTAPSSSGSSGYSSSGSSGYSSTYSSAEYCDITGAYNGGEIYDSYYYNCQCRYGFYGNLCQFYTVGSSGYSSSGSSGYSSSGSSGYSSGFSVPYSSGFSSYSGAA